MKIIIGTLLFFVFASANASLIDRGEGFIYDDVLDITWTQNANINGLATWDDQMAWAAGYSQTHSIYGTFDDWRLPSMDVNGDSTVVYCKYASELECRDNELAYLFWQYGIGKSSPGIFNNIQFGNYVSATELAGQPYFVWGVIFTDGTEFSDFKNVDDDFAIVNYSSWAVRDGDVVPIPAAVWLFGSALVGLAGFRRIRRPLMSAPR